MRRERAVRVAHGAEVAIVPDMLDDRLGDPGEAGIALRELDDLAPSAAILLREGGEHGERAVARYERVQLGGVMHDAAVLGVAVQAHRAVQRGERGPVCRELGPRATATRRRHRDDDQPGVRSGEVLVVEPERGHGTGREVVDDDVGDSRELEEELAAALVPEVQRE